MPKLKPIVVTVNQFAKAIGVEPLVARGLISFLVATDDIVLSKDKVYPTDANGKRTIGKPSNLYILPEQVNIDFRGLFGEEFEDETPVPVSEPVAELANA